MFKYIIFILYIIQMFATIRITDQELFEFYKQNPECTTVSTRRVELKREGAFLYLKRQLDCKMIKRRL